MSRMPWEHASPCNYAQHGVRGAANTTAGPEVVPLAINATETRTSADGSLIVGGTFTAADYVGPLKGAPFDEIHAHIHESELYVVVPTRAHPAGEIKGAISPVMLSDNN